MITFNNTDLRYLTPLIPNIWPSLCPLDHGIRWAQSGATGLAYFKFRGELELLFASWTIAGCIAAGGASCSVTIRSDYITLCNITNLFIVVSFTYYPPDNPNGCTA